MARFLIGRPDSTGRRVLEARDAMRVRNQVLVSFFESGESAQRARVLVDAAAPPGWLRPAVIVRRETDGSRVPFDVPATPPLGAVAGAVAGLLVGWPGGELGLVLGFFFGLYAGVLADGWRTLARGDILDTIQDALAPGHAALAVFAGISSTARLERDLAATGAVTLHRFAGNAIEADLAREVGAATTGLGDRVLTPEGLDGERGAAGRTATHIDTLRTLTTLDAVADRLLWIERIEFGSEVRLLNRRLRETPRWRAGRTCRQLAGVRASHARRRNALETSRDRLHAARSLVEETRVAARTPSESA